MKHRLLAFILPLIVFFLFSCKKDSVSADTLLYGSWKTSYGDTITFSKENNTDILTYNISLNPLHTIDTKTDFRYTNDKLEIKRIPGAADFSRLETFKWKTYGKSFEVQGVEWFMFLSSTITYFTFTKFD